MLKILIVDDHSLFVEGVYHILDSLIDQLILLEASCAKEGLLIAANNNDLDLVLLDLDLPDSYGLEALVQFKQNFPLLPVIILTASDKQIDMRQAMNSGAVGYLHKVTKGNILLSVIKLVLAGGIYIPPALLETLSDYKNNAITSHHDATHTQPGIALKPSGISDKFTSRESEVITHMSNGLSNKEIALRLGISESTIKTHVAAIFKKLNVSNRTKAVYAIYHCGLKIGGAHNKFRI